ncbi:hypothetical protein EVAR_22249_1 [Eumeta japonica]|uniref:Uncharacterized protein n=1 Tax=Eumeta variegata TaxID=151549 RepID=A0A4C1UAJ0_EUMVA|nr:hypothetical protein EVAR_22249_1 [Eumeta japonica]
MLTNPHPQPHVHTPCTHEHPTEDQCFKRTVYLSNRHNVLPKSKVGPASKSRAGLELEVGTKTGAELTMELELTSSIRRESGLWVKEISLDAKDELYSKSAPAEPQTKAREDKKLKRNTNSLSDFKKDQLKNYSLV